MYAILSAVCQCNILLLMFCIMKRWESLYWTGLREMRRTVNAVVRALNLTAALLRFLGHGIETREHGSLVGNAPTVGLQLCGLVIAVVVPVEELEVSVADVLPAPGVPVRHDCGGALCVHVPVSG